MNVQEAELKLWEFIQSGPNQSRSLTEIGDFARQPQFRVLDPLFNPMRIILAWAEQDPPIAVKNFSSSISIRLTGQPFKAN